MKLRSLLLSASLATVLTAAVWWATQPLGQGSGPLTAPLPAASSSGEVVAHTVQPGDTLWSIARRAQPSGDPRPLVDRLTRSRGGRSLQVGEEILVPRLGQR